MTFDCKNLICRIGILLVPLLFFGTSSALAAVQAPTTVAAPTETRTIQLLSMEFRHPVEDGALMRMIWKIDGVVKDAVSAEEIAEKGLDPNALIPCLAEFVAKEFTNGRRLDIHERYIPWTPALAARLHAVIAAQNLAAENDYGARAETVTNPAYNILIAYANGRRLYITSEGQTLNEHEAGVEDALLTWADEAFAAADR